jgi:hypothetical protein
VTAHKSGRECHTPDLAQLQAGRAAHLSLSYSVQPE